MNFIRDNILKIGVFLLIAIIVIVVVVSCSNKNGVGIDDSTGYIEMENKLQTAAIKYVKKNQNLLPKTVDQPRKINLDTLVNNRMLNVQYMLILLKKIKKHQNIDILHI